MLSTMSSRGLKSALCAAFGAAILSLGAADAMAQGDEYSKFRRLDRVNATSSYGYQVAPGYDRPDFDE